MGTPSAMLMAIFIGALAGHTFANEDQLEDQYAINLNFFNDADLDPNVEGWSLKDREEDYADYFKSLIQQFKRPLAVKRVPSPEIPSGPPLTKHWNLRSEPGLGDLIISPYDRRQQRENFASPLSDEKNAIEEYGRVIKRRYSLEEKPLRHYDPYLEIPNMSFLKTRKKPKHESGKQKDQPKVLTPKKFRIM